MNEDFVTFELAKKLKEKGFREKCIAYYWENINEHTPFFVVEDNMPEDGICLLKLLSNHNCAEWSHFIDAPTISQVLKWLREEKNIFVVVFIDDDSDCPVTYNIFKGTDCVCHHHEEYFALSEWSKCEMAGIEYVLDNLI